jgi:hypothetical protein
MAFRRIAFVLAGAMLATSLIITTGLAGETGQFTAAPTEGPPGTVIDVASITPCPPLSGPNPRVFLTVGGAGVFGVTELPISSSGGPWQGQLTVMDEQPSGTASINAQCVIGESDSIQPQFNYAPVAFEVTAPPAEPPPPAPPVPSEARFTG